jgi:hypothetical protein
VASIGRRAGTWEVNTHSLVLALIHMEIGIAEARDTQALILPGPNTTTNAAHNVPFDVFAFGGWPLFVSYLAILSLLLSQLLKSLRNRKYDAIFVTLTTAWACYQLQSIISINQIGLAVWGWLFGGALIAYEIATRPKGLMTHMSAMTAQR